MDILTTQDLVNSVGLKSFNSVGKFLGIKEQPLVSLVRYLKERKIIEDVKVECIDIPNVYKWLYEDLLFVNTQNIRSLEQGYYFEDYNKAKKILIDIDTHKTNVVKYDLTKVDITCINRNNSTFYRCPFTGYTNDSRLISQFIKNKFRLDPILLIEDILEAHNIVKTCAYCGSHIRIKYKKTKTFEENVSTFCEECLNKFHFHTLKVMSEPSKKKEEKTSYYIQKFYDLQCPFCGKKVKNTRQFAKHISNYSLSIMQYFKEFCSDGVKHCMCCDKEAKTTDNSGKKYYVHSYYEKLKEIFYDYDYVKDFSIYRDTCGDCYNKSLLVKFKKIYSYVQKRQDVLDDSIKKLVEDIRHNYHNLLQYENDINRLLNYIRENTQVSLIEYKGMRYYVYSKLEEGIIKKIIDDFKPDTLVTNWDVSNIIGTINYELDGKVHRYVPDVYLSKNGRNYLMEIKSDFILKQTYDTAIRKFKAAFSYCETNNIKFLIFIDGYGVLTLDKLQNIFTK